MDLDEETHNERRLALLVSNVCERTVEEQSGGIEQKLLSLIPSDKIPTARDLLRKLYEVGEQRADAAMEAANETRRLKQSNRILRDDLERERRKVQHFDSLVDFMRGRISRREARSKVERKALMKEILDLRQQLFRMASLGQTVEEHGVAFPLVLEDPTIPSQAEEEMLERDAEANALEKLKEEHMSQIRVLSLQRDQQAAYHNRLLREAEGRVREEAERHKKITEVLEMHHRNAIAETEAQWGRKVNQLQTQLDASKADLTAAEDRLRDAEERVRVKDELVRRKAEEISDLMHHQHQLKQVIHKLQESIDAAKNVGSDVTVGQWARSLSLRILDEREKVMMSMSDTRPTHTLSDLEQQLKDTRQQNEVQASAVREAEATAQLWRRRSEHLEHQLDALTHLMSTPVDSSLDETQDVKPRSNSISDDESDVSSTTGKAQKRKVPKLLEHISKLEAERRVDKQTIRQLQGDVAALLRRLGQEGSESIVSPPFQPPPSSLSLTPKKWHLEPSTSPCSIATDTASQGTPAPSPFSRVPRNFHFRYEMLEASRAAMEKVTEISRTLLRFTDQVDERKQHLARAHWRYALSLVVLHDGDTVRCDRTNRVVGVGMDHTTARLLLRRNIAQAVRDELRKSVVAFVLSTTSELHLLLQRQLTTIQSSCTHLNATIMSARRRRVSVTSPRSLAVELLPSLVSPLNDTAPSFDGEVEDDRASHVSESTNDEPLRRKRSRGFRKVRTLSALHPKPPAKGTPRKLRRSMSPNTPRAFPGTVDQQFKV